MRFCSECGQPVESTVPDGDNRARFVCTACGFIHYRNPIIVAGCVPELNGKILLCRRAIEPRHGYWTVPAGFMELQESLPEAALRETWEEALARVELGHLFAVVDVVHAGQVHVFFTGKLTVADFAPGEESLETKLFSPDAIPWDDLAFPSVRVALERYFENQRAGSQQLHLCTAERIGS